MRRRLAALLMLSLLLAAWRSSAGSVPSLDVGTVQYAFDHTGDQTNLAGICLASGYNVIYTGLLGADGYNGLPSEAKLATERRAQSAYLKKAKASGIQLAIGYVCATSIVKLNTFDTNWPRAFRRQFRTPPAQWRQLDRQGKPLVSWYGAPYEPACMNNPDWRAYEKAMIKLQLNAGCDGIFFDNPTVHPNGCYCPACMGKFDAFLAAHPSAVKPKDHSVEALRAWAAGHRAEFLEFRAGIAADFLAEMRAYARTIKPRAVMTCNNSLNVPSAIFSQCRVMGYDLDTASQAEDFITIEDMATQARRLDNGKVVEYAPTYHELHAVCHSKPIVATTLCEGDYHAAPHLARLSMAEAAANDASWMLWPTWPDKTAKAMAATIFPEADLLRRNAALLNNTDPRSDVLLFLCFRRWLETETCAISTAAAALSMSNIQYTICSERTLAEQIATGSPVAPLLVVESLSLLNPAEKQAIETFKLCGGRIFAMDEKDWLGNLRRAMDKPSIVVHGPPTVRAIVRDQDKRTIVHLYNLDIRRLSMFDDQVSPAERIKISLRVPFKKVGKVRALTADAATTVGNLPFTSHPDGDGCIVDLVIPRLEISAILVAEP
jgi:hypothetical protein